MIKKIIIIISGIIIAFLAVVFIRKIFFKTTTADEWLVKQKEYVDAFSDFDDSYNTVFTLYMQGGLTEANFLMHVDQFENELQLMKTAYDKEKPKINIKSYTYANKKGIEAIENLFSVYSNLLKDAKENSGNKEALLYSKLAYKQDVEDCLLSYITSVSILNEEVEKMQGGKDKQEEATSNFTGN